MPTTDLQQSIRTLAHLIREARCMTCLTGAGMSTESGIPDFRSRRGLYATTTSPRVFDIDAFHHNPAAFYRFAKGFFGDIIEAQPNQGHCALAALEHDYGKTVRIATQNIDTLHQAAGSTIVYPVHGTTDTCTCTRCGEQRYTSTIWRDVLADRLPIHTTCGGMFKPDIVFFGEQLPQDVLMQATKAVQNADLLLVMGTSLEVYPAAGLPDCRRGNAPMAIINKTPTARDQDADVVIHSGIGRVLTEALQMI